MAYVRPVLELKFKLLYGPAGQAKFGLVARAQCYKTLYGRNFQMFVLNWGVCAWQAGSSLVEFSQVRLEPTPLKKLSSDSLLDGLMALPTNIRLG